MATWNVAFEASPANADSPSQGASKIRETRVEVADRLEKEHTWNGAVADDGVHKAGSAKVYFTTATPTLQPDGVTALGSGDKGRLYWKSSTGSALLIHNATGFTSTGVTLSTAQVVKGVKTFADGVGFSSGGASLKCKVLSIGAWNMDTTATKNIQHGLDSSKIRMVTATIRQDGVASNGGGVDLLYPRQDGVASGHLNWYSTATIQLSRTASQQFDNVFYTSTGMNRGWVTIWYEA